MGSGAQVPQDSLVLWSGPNARRAQAAINASADMPAIYSRS
ncbi:hypothetical protein [Nonomuraea indica]|nr:hypothetical protein [Nonomuraea indica]